MTTTDTVLVKVVATIVVRVPNDHPAAQATDGLNDTFHANTDLVVDWVYQEIDGTRAQVLDVDPDAYEEGDVDAATDHNAAVVEVVRRFDKGEVAWRDVRDVLAQVPS